MGTYPYIVADMNGFGIFQSLVPLLHIQGMTCCIESAVGSNKHVVAKGNGRSVQDDAVHIAVEVFTQVDVIAVVTIERLFDEKVLSGLSQQFTKQLLPFFDTGWQQLVIAKAEVLALCSFCNQFSIIVGIVELAEQTFFLFCLLYTSDAADEL